MTDNTKPSKPELPGTEKIGLQLPTRLTNRMKRLRKARHLFLGSDPHLCTLYREAVEQYVTTIDAETGMPAAGHAQQLKFSLPGLNLPLFDACSIERDEDLFCAADESGMMVWASNPQIECVYVSPALVRYTGRVACVFGRMEWAKAVHPADRGRLLAHCAETYKTRQIALRLYRFQRKDHLFGWVLEYAQPRFRRDGTFAGYVSTMYQVCGTDKPLGLMASSASDTDRELALGGGCDHARVFMIHDYAHSRIPWVAAELEDLAEHHDVLLVKKD